MKQMDANVDCKQWLCMYISLLGVIFSFVLICRVSVVMAAPKHDPAILARPLNRQHVFSELSFRPRLGLVAQNHSSVYCTTTKDD